MHLGVIGPVLTVCMHSYGKYGWWKLEVNLYTVIESFGYRCHSVVEGMGCEMGLEHEGNESSVKWGLMMDQVRGI